MLNRSKTEIRQDRMFCMPIPGLYCSTMAGTSPHFPAVNTCPPSTAIASASSRCVTGETAINQVGQNTGQEAFHSSSLKCFTMIIFRHSSTEMADWHWMAVCSPSVMLMLQSSHFLVSNLPTAHHLIGLGADKLISAEERMERTDWSTPVPPKKQTNKKKHLGA